MAITRRQPIGQEYETICIRSDDSECLRIGHLLEIVAELECDYSKPLDCRILPIVCDNLKQWKLVIVGKVPLKVLSAGRILALGFTKGIESTKG